MSKFALNKKNLLPIIVLSVAAISLAFVLGILKLPANLGIGANQIKTVVLRQWSFNSSLDGWQGISSNVWPENGLLKYLSQPNTKSGVKVETSVTNKKANDNPLYAVIKMSAVSLPPVLPPADTAKQLDTFPITGEVVSFNFDYKVVDSEDEIYWKNAGSFTILSSLRIRPSIYQIGIPLKDSETLKKIRIVSNTKNVVYANIDEVKIVYTITPEATTTPSPTPTPTPVSTPTVTPRSTIKPTVRPTIRPTIRPTATPNNQ